MNLSRKLSAACVCIAALAETLTFGAANDIQISQKNSSDTAWAQRIIAGDSAFTTQAGFKSAIGLGIEDSPAWTALTLSGATPLTLAGGGTVTAVNGSISFVAAGTNRDVTFTPSGSGKAVSSGVFETLNSINLGVAAVNGLISWDASNVLLRSGAGKGIVFQVNAASEQTKYHSTGIWTFGTVTDSSNGRIQLATHTTSAGGLSFGTRAAEVIYRTANDTLRTDATWQLGRFTQAITDTRSGAGAVSVTTDTTKLTSTGGAQAITIADGVDGQIKRIVHDVDGGSMVLTPTTKTGFSTVTFTNAGDSATLQYVTTRGWICMGSYGATVAP